MPPHQRFCNVCIKIEVACADGVQIYVATRGARNFTQVLRSCLDGSADQPHQPRAVAHGRAFTCLVHRVMFTGWTISR
eukprot:11225990-Lingulodinium_polyedra.AAC.1